MTLNKPFSIQYTHKQTGQALVERPRLIISIDCAEYLTRRR
jgi:hypothetical protein